jgi:hypothetical protein
MDHGPEHVGHVAPVERAAAAQHFVEHRAEGPDVAAAVGIVPTRLFGAHVCGRSQNHADARRQRR